MKRIAVIVGVLLALGPMGSYAQNGHDLFQKALVKERTEGDLETAIALHERITKECANDRPLAAKALLHLGQCYEKLGNDEARKTYERLVQEYADQTEVAAEARERLVALRTSGGKEDLTIRQVSEITDFRGAPSPDSRYLSFVNWGTDGDLALLDLESGETRLLTSKGERYEDHALFSRWSPDSRRIAFDWFVSPDHIELRIISRDGGETRTLRRFGEAEWIRTYDWSPKSDEILVWVERKGGTHQITAVAERKGAMRVLKSFTGRGHYPTGMRFSPDGDWIAYDLQQRPDSLEHDVYIISANGGDEALLVRHPADDHFFGWAPKGHGVLFASDRTGAMDLWFLPVIDGRVAGEPRKITSGVEHGRPLGFDQHGTFYYCRLPTGCDVYTCRVNPDSGAVVAAPRKLVQCFEGANFWAEYSPDGTQLAYVRGGNLVPIRPLGNLPAVLCIRTLASGEERRIPTKFAGLAGPHWDPGGRQLYLAARMASGMELWRLDLGSGQFRQAVPQATESQFAHCGGHEVTPDGETLIYERRPIGSESIEIVARNLRSGEERVVYGMSVPYQACSLALSPDGKRVALMNRANEKVIRVISLSTGEAQDILKFEEKPGGGMAIDWSADGRYVIFPRQRMSSEGNFAGTDFCRVPAGGGEPQTLVAIDTFPFSLSVHPDGQQMVFSVFDTEQDQRGIWAVENFLPTLASAE